MPAPVSYTHLDVYKRQVVNLDFADVVTIMKDTGVAHMGVGKASGEKRAEDAVKMAISSPLLETTIDGARGVIINVTASADIDLEDVEMASSMISRAAHPDATIIWGAALDETLDDEMRVTVIATGFVSDGSYKAQENPAPAGAANPAAAFTQTVSGNAHPEEDADYIDIMSIFNKRKD